MSFNFASGPIIGLPKLEKNPTWQCQVLAFPFTCTFQWELFVFYLSRDWTHCMWTFPTLRGAVPKLIFCNTWSPTRLPTQSCAVLPKKLVFLIRRSSSWQACSSNIVRRRNVEVVSFWLCYFVFPTFVISCRYYRPYNLEIHHISSCYQSYQDSGHFPSTNLFSSLYIQVDVTSLRVFTTTNSLLFHR